MMLVLPEPRDFVIATGEANSLRSFAERAFAEVGLDWREHVEVDPAFLRHTELSRGVGNPSLASEVVGWKARYRMRDVVRMKVEGERGSLVGNAPAASP